MGKIIEPIRIEIPLGIMFQTVNCYLIPGEQLTLIDCGLYTKENWQLFQEKIQDHGYTVSDIEQIIISHEHRDHIGMLPELLEHSAAKVLAPMLIKDWFVQPEKMTRDEIVFTQNLLKTLGFPKEQEELAFNFFEAREITRPVADLSRLHFFEEGESVRMGNADWEVLNTPGHCPTQHVFLQQDQQRIFGSDMLLPVAPMPIPFDAQAKSFQHQEPLHALLDSYERLKPLNIQTVYPGHGNIFSYANQAIDKQLARIHMRKEECFEAIKLGLATPYQINRKMYAYQNTPPDFSGIFMVIGYLSLLEKEERILKDENQEGTLIYHVLT